MISRVTSRASAAFFFFLGAASLFAPDVMLGAMAPGAATAVAWLVQLLAAAWLGLAALNWLQRDVVIGGIYGRPLVAANYTVYFVSALSLLRVVIDRPASTAARLLAVVMTVFAVIYGALMFRGPFDPLDSGARGKP